MKRTRASAWVVLGLGFGVFCLQAQESGPKGAAAQAASAAMVVATSSAGTVVPRLVQFNGVVSDASGKPVTGTATVTFSLYEFQEGGRPLWSETQSLELDSQGHYTAFLGAASPDGLPLDLFASGSARWLGIAPRLPGIGELPRVLLVGVPYALKAADADTLNGLPATAFVQAGQGPGSVAAAGASGPGSAGSPERGSASGSSAAPGQPNAKSAHPNTTIADYLPYWNGTSNVGNSAIYQSGSFIGVGTTTPAWPFQLVATSPTTPVLNVSENSATTGASLAGFTALGAAGVVNNQFYADGLGTGPLGTPGGYIGTYSNHPFALFTSNTERMRVTTGGWIGVGTTNPQWNFHLVATNTTEPVLNVVEDNATTGASRAGFTALGAAGVVNNQFYADGLGTGPLGTPGGYIGTYSNHPFAFFTNNTERLLVTATGLVGIGTSSPAATLEVNGTSKFDQTVTFANGQTFPGTGTITQVTAGTGLSGGGTTGNVTLTNTGVLSVGFGTGVLESGPANMPILSLDTTFTDGRYLQLTGGTVSGGLTVNGANGFTGSAPTALFVYGGTGAGTGSGGLIQLTGGTGGLTGAGSGGFVQLNGGLGGPEGPGGDIVLTAGAGGSGGVGGNGGDITLQPGAGAPPDGSRGFINFAPQGGNVIVGGGTPTVNFEIASGLTTLADAWTTRSSRRWKTNIKTLPDALQKVEQLRGVSYERKDSGKPEIGVIAEEVGQVVPEVVSYDKNGVDAQGVDYSRLTALLIEATKEQQRQIARQAEEIRSLTRQVKVLTRAQAKRASSAQPQPRAAASTAKVRF